MAKLATPNDLEQFREAKRLARKLEASTGTIITVGMGTCGIAAGARETLAAIREELARRRIDARLGIVGCIGICVKEPLVDIQQAGKPRITYGNIQPDMVPELIEEHLVRGHPVKQWLIGRLAVE